MATQQTSQVATGRICDRDAYTLRVNFTLFLRYLRPLYAFTPATGSYFVVIHYTYQEERKIGYVNNNTSDHPRVYSHNEEGTRTQSSRGICGGGQVRERRLGMYVYYVQLVILRGFFLVIYVQALWFNL